MHIAHEKSRRVACSIDEQRIETRCFANHYGAVKRHHSPERALRVYPPLGWGVGSVLPHVRRAAHGAIAHRAIEVASRVTLTL